MVGFVVVRLDLDGLVCVLDCILVLLQPQVDERSIAVGRGHFGVVFDALCVILDGFFEVLCPEGLVSLVSFILSPLFPLLLAYLYVIVFLLVVISPDIFGFLCLLNLLFGVLFLLPLVKIGLQFGLLVRVNLIIKLGRQLLRIDFLNSIVDALLEF